MNNEHFKIVLAVNPMENQYITLLDFMLVTTRNLTDGGTRAPAPSSTADYICNSICSLTETDMDDIIIELCKISLRTRNEQQQKYCLDVVEEIEKLA
jgi:hypothetical protein